MDEKKILTSTDDDKNQAQDAECALEELWRFFDDSVELGAAKDLVMKRLAEILENDILE